VTRPLLGLDDVILDLTSTANRADAFQHGGHCREVAARGTAETALAANQRNEDSDKNFERPRLPPTVIEQVKVGPSQSGYSDDQSAGTRPINNVVDVTNYILLEWGQPLHAFDRDSLQGSDSLTLGVRLSQRKLW